MPLIWGVRGIVAAASLIRLSGEAAVAAVPAAVLVVVDTDCV